MRFHWLYSNFCNFVVGDFHEALEKAELAEDTSNFEEEYENMQDKSSRNERHPKILTSEEETNKPQIKENIQFKRTIKVVKSIKEIKKEPMNNKSAAIDHEKEESIDEDEYPPSPKNIQGT